jgi:hypothetical protein
VSIKVCSKCGRSYGSGEWRGLSYVGPQPDPRGGVYELRNCACGTTLAVEVAPVPGDWARLPSTIPPPPRSDS